MVPSWIKMRVDLDDHPHVVRIARGLNADRLRVIGGLWAVWSLFDTHSPDGMLDGYTLSDIDASIGWPGFAEAMVGVGWLVEHEYGIEAPEYGEHNGATAKRRAMETKRKAGERGSGGGGDPGNGGGKSASNADKGGDSVRMPSGEMSAADADEMRARGRGRDIGIQIQPIPDGIGRRQDGDPPALALVGPLPKPERTPPDTPARSKPPDCPHAAILALWAEVLPAMPQHDPQQWRGARADHLRARWREVATSKHWQGTEDGITYFRRLFGYVGQSRFLTGRVTPRDPGKPPFTVTLAWLVKPENWAKTIEGTYHESAA